MPSDNLKRRLDALERKSQVSDAVLTFADGSTRSVRLKDPLGIFCAACDLQSWKAGPPEGLEADAERRPRPVSPFDFALDLFSRAVKVESEDRPRFLQLVLQMCQEARAREEGESAKAFLERMGRIKERDNEGDVVNGPDSHIGVD
jgi:hypothetical protein